MEVLITGGNGLLGRHGVSALHERGDNVRVVALAGEDASALEERGVPIHRGDIRSADTLPVPWGLGWGSGKPPRRSPPARRSAG